MGDLFFQFLVHFITYPFNLQYVGTDRGVPDIRNQLTFCVLCVTILHIVRGDHMQILTIFFIALGLSMDAFAVQLSNGMCYRNFGRRQAVIASFTFGLFQAAMPVIGYFAGYFFSSAISFLDHWIALILLGFIGGSMVWEAVRGASTSGGWL